MKIFIQTPFHHHHDHHDKTTISPNMILSMETSHETCIETIQQEVWNRMGDGYHQNNELLFFFQGQVMESNHQLKDYHVQNGSTLNVSFGGLWGGAQLGKSVKGRSSNNNKNNTNSKEQDNENENDNKEEEEELNQKSKPKKNKDDQQQKLPTEQEKQLLNRIERMEYNDYQKKLAGLSKIQLKEKYLKEENNSKMNRLKIQNQWRKIMRLAKVENLRKELEILSQNHERDVDRKDAMIQMLDRDLEEADEQFEMARRSHALNMDKCLDLQDERLSLMEQEFEKELHMMEIELNDEKEKIIKQHAMEKKELLDILKAVDQEEHEREADAKQEHEQLREEIRNKNLEDINVLRITLDSNIEELEQHFETAHLNYLQNTDQRTQDFKYLTAKDQDLSKDIEMKIRKIERLQSNLNNYKMKMTQMIKENMDRNQALKDEKDMINQHFQQLKQKMNTFRQYQSKRLTDCSNHARKAKQTLQQHLLQAEKILMCSELNRKLETEREKILPFYTSSTIHDHSLNQDKKQDDGMMKTINEMNEEERNQFMMQKSFQDDNIIEKNTPSSSLNQKKQIVLSHQSTGVDPLNEKENLNEMEYLNHFYKRYNKVLLDEIAIKKEKNRLERENSNLQQIIQQYLDGISINNQVMNQRNNPLLIINGRLHLNNPTPSTSSETISVIEATHELQNNHRVHHG